MTRNTSRNTASTRIATPAREFARDRSAKSLSMAGAAAAALSLAVWAVPARAHVVVGDRTFPVTLTFDDPGVGDEATLPQIVEQRSAGPANSVQLQWEYDKTITPTTALIYNGGYDFVTNAGDKRRTGFETIVITGKWQALTVPEHELVVSVGVMRAFAGGHATQGIGGDEYGSTLPTIYAGRGFGDFAPSPLRPFAISGELSYVIPDHPLNLAGDNNGTPRQLQGGVSLQYSLPYYNAQIHALPGFLANLIPLVELDYGIPAGGPAPGISPSWTVAPGFIYVGDTFQAGLEALIPANHAAGQNVGVIAQVHYFFDDLFPNSLGKPLFN